MRTGAEDASARKELARSWRILVGAFLGVSAGVSALPYYTQGLFVPPLAGEFGWSRAQLSLITLAGGMVLAVSSPVVGLIVDRVGIRIPLILSFTSMIACYMMLSKVGPSFLVFFLIQLAIFALGSITGPVAFTRIINQRFVAMRGLALGVTVAGAGAMAVIAPPLVAETISAMGWRGAYRAVALLMLVLGCCSLMLLWRGSSARKLAAVSEQGAAANVSEATRSPLFWRLLATFVLLALGIGGLTFHLVPLLTDTGVSLTRAAGVQSLIGVSVLIGRVGAGFLVDRFFAPRISALVMTLAALGVAGLAIAGPVLAPVCALLIGFALGAEGDIIGYLTARYFGLRLYGRIYGILYGAFALGLGLSPLIISRMEQSSGSYTGALWASFACLVIGASSMSSLPRFKDAQ